MKFTPQLAFFDVRVIMALVSILITIVLIAYSLLKGKKTKLLASFMTLQIIVAAWSIARIWELLSPSRDGRWAATYLLYSAICFIGFGWLLFCGYYTENRIISRKSVAVGFAVPPALMYLSMATNDFHHLFFESYSEYFVKFGILYWVHITFTYAYVVIGIVILIRYAIGNSKQTRLQSFFIVIAALLPFLSNIFTNTLIVFKPFSYETGLDMTPLSLSISLLLFILVSFKYRFLNIIPIAWQKIINNMKESIIVIDKFDTIVNYNSSFVSHFPSFIRTGSEKAAAFAAQVRDTSEDTPENGSIITAIEHGTSVNMSGELVILDPEWKCFSVYIQSISDSRGAVHGRIVMFNDISGYRKLLGELSEKNDAVSAMNERLSRANEQLKDHALAIEELTITKERNRIARDAHDTLGHTMTLLIALIEVGVILCDQNPAETKARLVEAARIARDGLKELRGSINRAAEAKNLIESLKKLFSDFAGSGMKVDFSVDGGNNALSPRYTNAIFRICQEALTNALRHGKANLTSVFLRFDEHSVKLYIFDNGTGCAGIVKGMGLAGMEQRVSELNGKIEYGSGGDHGFNLNIELPV